MRVGEAGSFAEPGAYSIDIRWCVVYQRVGMNLQFSDIHLARRMNIATSTAHRIDHQFEQTGNIEPVCYNET